jgi:hypothetical protein
MRVTSHPNDHTVLSPGHTKDQRLTRRGYGVNCFKDYRYLTEFRRRHLDYRRVRTSRTQFYGDIFYSIRRFNRGNAGDPRCLVHVRCTGKWQIDLPLRGCPGRDPLMSRAAEGSDSNMMGGAGVTPADAKEGN